MAEKTYPLIVIKVNTKMTSLIYVDIKQISGITLSGLNQLNLQFGIPIIKSRASYLNNKIVVLSESKYILNTCTPDICHNASSLSSCN